MSISDHTTLLFLGTIADKPYLSRLKECVGSATVYVQLDVEYTSLVVRYCKERSITGVISTDSRLLNKLLKLRGCETAGSIDNYSGSIFDLEGVEVLFIDPLDHLISVPYGKFLTKRYVSKLIGASSWIEYPAFEFAVITNQPIETLLSYLDKAMFLACDIETTKEPLAIKCIGFTAIWADSDGGLITKSYVLPIDSMYAVVVMRRLLTIQAPKVFQNGKYDLAYLTRYNAPVYNYLFDTATMFHSWYSELPKDLGFLTGFFVRRSLYWKDLAKTNDLYEYYKYCALDTWGTAMTALGWLLEAPTWAKSNYLKEFPLLFPCHLCEMTGIKRDSAKLAEARVKIDGDIREARSSLDIMLGVSNFNTNSPVQMKALLKILGCQDLETTSEPDLVKAAFRHPLNSRILNKVLDIRGWRKLVSTYLRTDDDITKTSKGGAKEFNGRILYSLNPHGTDTGRLASREHHFWCGLQIQNIPRGKEVKSTLVADEGWLLYECDLEQAESRDTAYIVGDEGMIEAVSGTRDFHSLNAEAFFGIPYEEIFDDATGTQLNTPLRDVAKRTNHGANYNMEAIMLLLTMGEAAVIKTKALLKLPKIWPLIKVTQYLLDCFHTKYPKLKGLYYKRVISDVTTSNLLVGATGWTRYCFGNPSKNKRDLNAYVAHCPQSLNAMTLNEAFMKVFNTLVLDVAKSLNFKLLAQIHDSILFQVRVGHEYLAEEVKSCMEIPVTAKGCDGKVRTFTVPADLKGPAKYWSEL